MLLITTWHLVSYEISCEKYYVSSIAHERISRLCGCLKFFLSLLQTFHNFWRFGYLKGLNLFFFETNMFSKSSTNIIISKCIYFIRDKYRWQESKFNWKNYMFSFVGLSEVSIFNPFDIFLGRRIWVFLIENRDI